jgi:hypothetical protein
MPASARRPGRAEWQDIAIRGPECATSPAPFSGRRWWIACSSASSTKPAVAVRLTRLARDAPRVGVDDEGCVGEARPGRHVGEVADPKHVRRGRVELPVHAIQRARRGRVLDRRLHRLAPHRPAQPHGLHQSLHRAAGDCDPFAAQLPPDRPRAVRARRSRRARARSRGAARRLVGRGPRPGRGRGGTRHGPGRLTGRSPAGGRSARPRGTRGDRR